MTRATPPQQRTGGLEVRARVEKYPIFGSKHLDFMDFRQGVYIVKEKRHLTPEGLNELKSLSYVMNTYRKF